MIQTGGKRLRLLALLALVGVLLVLPGGARAQASTFHAISGVVYFDQNGNGRREPSDSLLSHAQPEELVNGQFVPTLGLSQGDGSYSVQVPPGTYTIRVILPGPDGNARPALASAPRTITVGAADVAGIDFGLTLPPTPHDVRFFSQTGYRIDSDLIWGYFNARGGVATFGYPVSRTFPFLGTWVQIFQRQILQIGGNVHELNLLDPGLLPVTSVNFSTFPAFDPSLAAQAPPVGSPTYAGAVAAFVRRHVPDVFEGLPVRFYQTFAGLSGNPLVGLELWGLPTSEPAIDPRNHHFVYQRFQRGIMHYDAGCNCTGGILLADTFKSVLLAGHPDLAAPPPADVAQEMRGSPYFDLYDPTKVDAVSLLLPGSETIPRAGGTNLAFAFVKS